MFERIKIYRPGRDVHKLSYSVTTDLNIGVVKPTMAIDCIPGDTFKFGQIGTVEFMPLVTPLKTDLYLESCAFFVPYDILVMAGETKLTEILTYAARNEDVQEPIPEIPKWNIDKTDVDSSSIIKDSYIGTLWDSFGFQTKLTDIDDFFVPLGYLQRAYNMIYNEYIRDENIDSEVALDSNDLQTVCWKKDYFTSALTSPQAGNAPSLKLSGTASAKWSNDVLNEIVGLLSNYQKISSTGNPHDEIPAETTLLAKGTNMSSSLKNDNYTSVSSSSTSVKNSELGIKVNQALLDLLNDNTLEMSNIITFNINDLRLLNKLQIWLERNAVAGSRTKEYLLANYGIAPNDETLQRPVFLGRLRTPIVINSNQSTAEVTGVPQGTKSGNATGQNGVMFKKWTCKEPGVLMTLSWLRPKAQYSKGINRQWIKNTVYDFYNPIFEGLGEQPIYKGELYISGTSSTDKSIFGYQEPFVFMKTQQDIVTGELRAGGSLEKWTSSRNFGSSQALNSTFLHVDYTQYSDYFALSNKPQSVATFSNVIKAIRPIHRHSVATL